MTAENKQIVLLAGYSAAGKSTLAREMRNGWGYNLIEHQPLVHSLATSKGYERARHWLAEVGVEKFANESVQEMVKKTRKIIDAGKTKVIFDVLYGTKMLELFRGEFPDMFILVVSVLADKDTRVENIQKRMGIISIEDAEKELHFRDSFLREVGLDVVLQQSDIEITNINKPIRNVASELNELIERYFKKR